MLANSHLRAHIAWCGGEGDPFSMESALFKIAWTDLSVGQILTSDAQSTSARMNSRHAW